MTFTVSLWLVGAGVCLALFGVWFLGRAAWQAGRHWWRDRPRVMWIRDWWYDWRRDRVTPLLEEETCPECGGTGVHEWDCPVDPALDPLPPERSREELGFTGELTRDAAGEVWPSDDRPGRPGWWMHWEREQERLERRAPKWEAEARGHYVAMGLDYPSGLMARVREFTP